MRGPIALGTADSLQYSCNLLPNALELLSWCKPSDNANNQESLYVVDRCKSMGLVHASGQK